MSKCFFKKWSLQIDILSVLSSLVNIIGSCKSISKSERNTVNWKIMMFNYWITVLLSKQFQTKTSEIAWIIVKIGWNDVEEQAQTYRKLISFNSCNLELYAALFHNCVKVVFGWLSIRIVNELFRLSAILRKSNFSVGRWIF